MNIFDEISLRILAVLAENPNKEYYQREIAKLAGVSIGATSEKMRKHAEDGLVTVRKSGRMMFYRYNLQDPLARQFKILLNINAIHELIQELSGYAKRVVLFGSYAEGTNVMDSDIDLLVLTDNAKKTRETSRLYGARIGKEISPVALSANEFQQLRSRDKPLYERINKGIVLGEAR